jgi:hypothetical protein
MGEKQDPGNPEYEVSDTGLFVLDENGRRFYYDSEGNRQSERDPDFVLPRHNVIREHNWPEYQQQGFVAVEPCVARDELTRKLDHAQASYGVANVYTGYPFDPETGAPYPSGATWGIYASPDGVKHHEEREERVTQWMAERDAETPADPDSAQA